MTPLISLENVSHRYGLRCALHPINFTIPRGERVGVAGPSGSGKSTLARILTGHLRPATGEVKVNRNGSSTEPRFSRADRRRFQLVFQDPGTSFAHHWKVWEVVAEAAAIEGKKNSEQRSLAKMLLERVHLPDAYADRHPLELSGGERRRIAIARALATNPELLVLDESLSGLDAIVQRGLCDLLTQLHQSLQLTLVTVSHDWRLLERLADRVLVLDEGRLVDDVPLACLPQHSTSPISRRLIAAAFRSPFTV